MFTAHDRRLQKPSFPVTLLLPTAPVRNPLLSIAPKLVSLRPCYDSDDELLGMGLCHQDDDDYWLTVGFANEVCVAWEPYVRPVLHVAGGDSAWLLHKVMHMKKSPVVAPCVEHMTLQRSRSLPSS